MKKNREKIKNISTRNHFYSNILDNLDGYVKIDKILQGKTTEILFIFTRPPLFSS